LPNIFCTRRQTASASEKCVKPFNWKETHYQTQQYCNIVGDIRPPAQFKFAENSFAYNGLKEKRCAFLGLVSAASCVFPIISY